MTNVIDIPVVDAHHHLTRLELGYPWLAPDAPTDRYHGDDRQLRADYLVEQYRLDARDLPLVASVHIENGASDPLEEARWIGAVIAEHSPIPAAHVARADLSSPDVVGMLEELADMPHVRGIRHILNWHPDPRVSHTPRPGIINEPRWRSSFARLSDLGLSFDLQVFPDQLGDAAQLASDFPETTIVLDHLGMPLSRDVDYLGSWKAGMRALAEQKNVSVKISAIGTTDHEWTTDSIRPLADATVEAFTPERVMFASNFPVDGMYSTLTELYSAFSTITSDYSRDERVNMFGRTASRVYRLVGLNL
jgi:predicted TIM-barrel fold metal-dependent hydrolase